MDGALGYVIHAVFGVFGGVILIGVMFSGRFGGVCVDSSGTGVDVGYIVEDGPEDSFAESVVPALFWVEVVVDDDMQGVRLKPMKRVVDRPIRKQAHYEYSSHKTMIP